MSEPSSPLRFARLTAPHAKDLNITDETLEGPIALMRAPYSPDLVGDPDTGVIAGGVVTTLLDHACGAAVMGATGASTPIATLDLRIDYMRPAEPGLDLFCRAHCYKVARSVAFVRAAAFERQESDPVATAQATFMLDTAASRPLQRPAS